MNTLIDAAKSRRSNPKPANPVDAALWGLAERLSATIDAPAPNVVSLAEGRLPKRSLGLPSAGRLAGQFAGKRKKAATSVAAKPPVVESHAPEPLHTAASLGRVEFTILKSRRENAVGTPADGQRPSPTGESQVSRKPERPGKPRRKRSGVTLLGWSLLVAGAAVAAAIALWGPAWL